MPSAHEDAAWARGRRSPWVVALVACSALLIVPVLGLLLLRPPQFRPPSHAPAIARPGSPEPAVSAADIPAGRNDQQLSGVVLDEQEHPIAGARIGIEGFPNEATSDQAGRFVLMAVPDEASDIRCSAEGFEPGFVTVAAADRSNPITCRLRAARPVVGLVLDADGKALPDAMVTCEDRTGIGATTDSEGRFVLPAPAAGCNAVALDKAGGRSDETRLQAGRENTLQLLRGGTIRGRVVDERGAGVPSFLVAIESFRPAGSGDGTSATGRARRVSDPEGVFSLENLLAGRYVLTVSAEGRPPTQSAAIDVEPGRTTQEERIVLSVGATLTGTVVDGATKAPIEGASVTLDSQTSTGANAIAPVLTDANGAFLLAGVPSTPFSIRVARDGYRTKIETGLAARGSPTLRAVISLSPRGDEDSATEFAGVGAVLAPSPKGVIVAGVFEDGPAARAGLRKGDRIERIDGRNADGFTVSECVQLLRGPEGSRVTVAVAREGQPNAEITIRRELLVR